MNYPIKCPYCWLEIDSMDSYADTKQDLRYHIQYKHPGEEPDNAPNLLDDIRGGGDNGSVLPVR